MEFTVSGYLVGFSLGQLLWGPVSDRTGRRVPVALGILLFILGSAGCALSGSPHGIIGWRVVQAVGACAGVVVSRAMVRDLAERDRAAQMLSTLIVIMAVAPPVGPLLGAQVLAFASWCWIFGLLVGVGALTLAALATVPETLSPERRDPDAVRHALRRYAALLADRRVLAYAGISGSFYVGAFAFIAGTPFAYIDYYHAPPSLYGLLFGASILAIMLVNMANSRLVPRFGSDRLLFAGAVAAAATGLFAAGAAWTGWGGLAGLTIPIVAFLGGERADRAQLARRRARRLAGPRGRGVGAGRRDPVRQRHPRLGPRRPVRRRDSLAARRGHRLGRALLPRVPPAAAAWSFATRLTASRRFTSACAWRFGLGGAADDPFVACYAAAGGMDRRADGEAERWSRHGARLLDLRWRPRA